MIRKIGSSKCKIRPVSQSRLILIVASLAIIALSLTACDHIEDTNGVEPSLVTITREQMAAKSISHTASGVSTTSSRNKVTSIGMRDDNDVDFLQLKGGKISGVKTILLTTLTEGEKLTINCDTTVTSGNLAVVLLSPDYEILYEFAVGESDGCVLTETDPGDYVVRIGTESFSGEITLERIFG